MPQAVQIIGGAALLTAGFFAPAPFNAYLISTGLGLLIGGLTYDEPGKMESLGQEQTTLVNSPIAPRRIVHGDRAWGGSLAYMESHGGSKQYLTWIQVICDEPVARLGEDYAGSEVLDGVFVDRKPHRFIKNIRAEFPGGEFGNFDDYVPHPGDGRNHDYWFDTSSGTL